MTPTGAQAVRRARLLVLAVALPVLAWKLYVAKTTIGTNDMGHWLDFLRAEDKVGPVGIYRYDFPTSLYNHPPLIGYCLHVVNWMVDRGADYRFVLRACSSLADVGTALVVFELVRTRRDVRSATASAIGVAASPVLFIVAGFHGNTDPIFVFFTILALWLLADRDRPVAAGVAIVVAASIKIVPFVVIPCLLVFAWRRGRACFARLVAAMAVVAGLIWGPALVGAGPEVFREVFGYAGLGPSPWGVIQIGEWLGSPWWVAFLTGPGRSLPVAICALVPAVVVWRTPSRLPQAGAWALIGFLALAITYGVQYTAWPLAACYLVDVAWATAFNVVGGAVLFVIYDRWAGGLPWRFAQATPFPPRDTYLLLLPWLVLLVAWARATRGLMRASGSNESGCQEVSSTRLSGVRPARGLPDGQHRRHTGGPA